MKKYALCALLLALLFNIASAQMISVTGSVKTKDGDPLHFAFVQDKQFKYGAYTDSLGNFTLTAGPKSQLRIRCSGFKDTIVNVNNRATFSISLTPAVNIVANRTNTSYTVDEHTDINIATLRDQIMDRDVGEPGYNRIYRDKGGHVVTLTAPTVDMAQGAIYPVFTHKEATQGSRYLFNDWVHGYVINAADSLVQRPDLYFNYDKIGGSLLLTRDKHAAIEIYRESARSFTLFDALSQPYTFTLVPEIDKSHYVQVIADGSSYKIYKLIKTKFIAANYSTDGLASTGNAYDEFHDDGTYYLVAKNGSPQKITLRKKALKEAFSANQAKLNDYIKTNSGDIDDNYLKDLGDYMNK